MSDSIPPPSLMTTEEAAAMLRTTQEAVWKRIQRGQMPGVVRCGKRALIRRDELRQHLGLLPERKP